MTKRSLLQAKASVVAIWLGSISVASAAETIWLEGEDADSHNFNQHNWYSSSDVQKDLFSPGTPGSADGEWLAHYSNGATEAEAEYSFNVQEGGTYTFWIRCNPFFTSHRYRIDGGAYTAIDVASDPRERLNLIAPSIDIRFLAWVKVGRFDLSAGSHTLTVQVQQTTRPGSSETHGGIDAMVLVNFQWAPSGAVKPADPTHEPAADEWFPLFVDDDPHDARSITDVSHLLHKPAGAHGSLNRNDKDFSFADGTRAVFWAVGAGMANTPELQQQQARYYAKHGINMVRQHPVQAVIGVLQDVGGGREFDAAKLDQWDRWFATLKENGIYMTWSCFYPHVITPADNYPANLYAELADRGAGKSTSGMVSFMTALQDAEWAWLEQLLEHQNPYTGMRYKDDPALAIVEVHNEDSIFWHAPLNQLAGGELPLHTAELQRQWGEWVRTKYGDDNALAQAWGAGARGGDSVNNDSMAIYGAWEMAPDGPQNQDEKARIGDFIRFLAEMQRTFYERRQQRLRTLGFSGVTVSTAWKAGGAAAGAANLWCDDAMDAIDRHNYFGGGDGGHSIEEGAVNNDTHMSQPCRGILSSGLFQVEDKPFIMTEWTQKPPNQWKAEIAPLMAFYGMGLQGWDASYHFAGSRPRMGSGWPGMNSYVTETPHYIGQFPALASSVHRGHYREAPIVAARRLARDDIFQGIDALSQDFTGGGYDENEPQGNLATPLEVMAIGRVTAKIADGLSHSEAADWDTHWNQTAETVDSITDELTWDYGQRVVLARGAKTQGIVGFAGGKQFELPGVTVDVTTHFVSLLFTPLDDRPLVDSSHILITALARDRQTGATYNNDGTQLLTAGGPPLMLEPVQATITFRGEPITSAVVVDRYGVPTDKTVEQNGNTITLSGRYATYYYEVTRPGGAVPDAGTVTDGAATTTDGAVAGDAGTDTTSSDDDGCNCSLASGSSGLGLILMAMLAALFVRRR